MIFPSSNLDIFFKLILGR